MKDRINHKIYIMFPSIWKCWREWWRVRKWFKFPKINIYWQKKNSLSFYCLFDKLFSFEIYPLRWKTKYTDYCFEGCPYIIFNLFRKRFLAIEFVAPNIKGEETNSHIYYESILDKIHGKYSYITMESEPLNIYEVYKNNIWTRYGKNNVEQKFTCLPYLTKYAKKEIEKINPKEFEI
ncbi:MAG: hypothetical protein J1F35_03430 [Erysipelotrichales bacterium]|nr:hypothetical protein [Erysipelotrichales bacterium]